MLQEIMQPGLSVVFVDTVVTALWDTLGFYHLHKRDRFWELLMIGGITSGTLVTPAEAKALEDGHRSGNLTDPVRMLFIEKKTGQLQRLGIGLAQLNRRVTPESERDPEGRPTADDVAKFSRRVELNRPRILAFVTPPEIFESAFGAGPSRVSVRPGLQPAPLCGTEAWYLGPVSFKPRGEAAAKQEDFFFALGERLEALKNAQD
jgi:G:T/U-mismatch repair DNA glycosylase